MVAESPDSGGQHPRRPPSAMSSSSDKQQHDPSGQHGQQIPNQLSITHDDYDWLGVLDNLSGADGSNLVPPASAAAQQQQNAVWALIDAAAAAAEGGNEGGTGRGGDHVPAAAAANSNSVPDPMITSSSDHHASSSDHHLPRRQSSVFSAASGPMPTSGSSTPVMGVDQPRGVSGEDKKQARVERKRGREKQRRLDTNTQFNSLVEVVRGIEVQDFAEEGRLSQMGGFAGVLAGQYGQGIPPAGAIPGGGVGVSSRSGGNCGPSVKPMDAKACPILAFNPSNRVDLIAHTIAQIQHLRHLRRTKNEELREMHRRNCEMRKDVEGLRRTIAHQKAMDLAPMNQQKVMTMVPMMMPQNQASQFGAGGFHPGMPGGAMMQPMPMMQAGRGMMQPMPMMQMSAQPQAGGIGVNPMAVAYGQQVVNPMAVAQRQVVNPMAVNPVAVAQGGGGQQQQLNSVAVAQGGGGQQQHPQQQQLNPMAVPSQGGGGQQQPQQQHLNPAAVVLGGGEQQQQVDGGQVQNDDAVMSPTSPDEGSRGGSPPHDEFVAAEEQGVGHYHQPAHEHQQQQSVHQQHHEQHHGHQQHLGQLVKAAKGGDALMYAMYPQMSGGVPSVQFGLHPLAGAQPDGTPVPNPMGGVPENQLPPANLPAVGAVNQNIAHCA